MRNVTIHSNHELSAYVENLLEGIGEAKLEMDVDQQAILGRALEEQGFTIALAERDFTNHHATLHVSKIEVK